MRNAILRNHLKDSFFLWMIIVLKYYPDTITRRYLTGWIGYNPLQKGSWLKQFLIECGMKTGIVWFCFTAFCDYFKKTRASYSTYQTQSHNHSRLRHVTDFPALGARYLYLLRVLIVSLFFFHVIGRCNYFGFSSAIIRLMNLFFYQKHSHKGLKAQASTDV